MVLLENHSLADDGYSYGLWYGQAGYDENDWVARWQALARRYRDRPNVIGADLKNEPHGDATWGTGGPTDWQPRGDPGGQRGHGARAGLAHRRRGHREARRRRQARHALVGRQPRGRAPASRCASSAPTASCTRRTSTARASSRSRGSAARTPRSSSERALARRLGLHRRERTSRRCSSASSAGARSTSAATRAAGSASSSTTSRRTGISWTYWALNPDSGDTGGVLTDDWTTPDRAKLALLQRTMRRQRIAFGGGPRHPRSPVRPGLRRSSLTLDLRVRMG